MTNPGGGTVNVPGVGRVKKEYVIVGVLGVLIVGGYTYYKKRQAGTATATATVNATDPATGYPFGSPEDAAALDAQNSYVQPASSGGGGGNSDVSPQPTMQG